MNKCARWSRIGTMALTGLFALLAATPGAFAADLEAQLNAAFARLDAQELELAEQRTMLLALKQELARRDAGNSHRVGTASVAPGTPETMSAAAAVVAESDVHPPAPGEGSAAQVAAAQAQQDDPTREVISDFSGALPIPGSRAALRFGGYVKSDLIHNVDPLNIQDRFIVGEIPVGETVSAAGVKAQSQITAAQSRLNLDLRQPARDGVFRAFVEGDFEGSGNTFRMRHAFGEWNSILTGQTWSTFMDTSASPEEIDFEGLNARINVRQTQMRFSPQLTELGRRHEFVFSLEDPNPEVADGTGLSEVPDFVASARFNWQEHTHGQVAVLLRQIRAEWETDPTQTRRQFGYGVSVSGRYVAPAWGERDQILFQINAGKGIGRYVNDLGTLGDFDGIFSSTGELELFDVYAGYVSAQHWWQAALRSNLTVGYVEVDSPDFVSSDSYKRTYRASLNLIWSPIPRLDIGGEYLWGERENVDGDSGDATQIQFATQFKF